MTCLSDLYACERVLIIAPHVDDEMIGCYSLLTNHKHKLDVAYLYEVDETRHNEAIQASQLFDFTPLFVTVQQLKDHLQAHDYDACVLPAPTDNHRDHKYVFQTFCKWCTHVYEVDMHTCTPALPDKRKWLDYVYKSQQSLWHTNASYCLFESIKRFDSIYVEYTQKTTCIDSSLKLATCKVPSVVALYESYIDVLELIKHIRSQTLEPCVINYEAKELWLK